MRWAGHVTYMGNASGMYKVVVGRPERKTPLERLGYRWEINNKINVEEVGCRGGHGLDYLAQDREMWWALVNLVMNLPVP